MRIIAGANRGTRLAAPKGADTRPTADRARESLFAILEGGRVARADGRLPVAGATVLDAFAGTGALGLEALSRGADRAIFIENDRPALAALKRNIEHCHAHDRATVLGRDALHPPPAGVPCDLVFLDPPYGQGLAGQALAALDGAGWVAPDALVVVQCHPKDALDPPAGYTILETRTVGAARFEFLRPRPGTGTSG